MIKEYRPYRSTRRWPCVVFFDILAFVSQASWVLYCVKSPNSFLAKRKYRKEFLYQLGHQLVVPTMIKRKLSPEYRYLHRDMKHCMSYMIKYCDDSLQSQKQGVSIASYRNNSSLLNVSSQNEPTSQQPDVDQVEPQLPCTLLPDVDIQDVLHTSTLLPDVDIQDVLLTSTLLPDVDIQDVLLTSTQLPDADLEDVLPTSTQLPDADTHGQLPNTQLNVQVPAIVMEPFQNFPETSTSIVSTDLLDKKSAQGSLFYVSEIEGYKK